MRHAQYSIRNHYLMTETVKRILKFVSLAQLLGFSVHAAVNVSADFTQPEDTRETLHDMWAVANRISPTDGVSVRPGIKVNTVRMIGGIVKRDSDGQRTEDPDLDFDTCTYDEENQRYVYHFDRLVDRIDKIRNGGTEIYQIVLDQPPWCFQRSYTFIAEGQTDGVNFRENERVSIYGNSLPPDNKEAYFDYIAALMQHLIDEYGEVLVKSWRFRVGAEIETPDHWHGNEEDFILHFANTERAIRSVLPDATIGLHTRPPDFVYTKNNLKNYKGEVIKSFANGLIEYCHDNNIRYDFWGISDYPIITLERTRDPKEKYAKLFEPLVTHPKWQAGTVIDLEEFSVITKISPLVSSDTAQAHTFLVAMTDQFYSNGVDQVFQWGQRIASHEHWRTEVFTEMVGKIRYQATISSDTPSDADPIGAIIATSEEDDSIDVVLYNYNPANLEAVATKDIDIELHSDVPSATPFYYRKTLLGREQNKFNTFMDNPASSSWLNTGFKKYGNTTYSLNSTGLAEWESYENPSPREWTQWQSSETLPPATESTGSRLAINTQLPLFSFEKIEIRWEDPTPQPDEEPGALLVGWEVWNTPVASASHGLSGTTANLGSGWAPNFRGGSADGTYGDLPTSIATADTTIGASSDFHYTGYRNRATGERSIDFVVTADAGVGFSLGKFWFDIISRGGNGLETWTLEILDGGPLTPGVVGTGTIEASFDANQLSDVNVDLSNLPDSRIEAGTSATFRFTLFTPDERSVDFDNVGITAALSQPADPDEYGNGLPDQWERDHFGSNGQTASSDTDGDGYSHLQEYILGTNPTRSESTLQVRLNTSEDTCTLTWNSTTGRRYNIYSTQDLASDSWTLALENEPGTGAPISHQTQVHPDQPTFFRLQVSYP